MSAPDKDSGPALDMRPTCGVVFTGVVLWILMLACLARLIF